MTDRNYLFDATRGIAALLVVAYHLGNFGYQIAPSGFLAVDVFFLLSGFVIAQAYEKRLSAGLSGGRFLLMRAIRLYPLIFAGLFLGLFKAICISALHKNGDYSLYSIVESAPFNFLLLPSPPSVGVLVPLNVSTLFPLNVVTWSLFFEIIANIVFAFWAYRASKLDLILTITLFAIVTTSVALSHSTMKIGWDWATFTGGLGRVGFSFTLGCLMRRLMDKRARRSSYWAALPMLALIIMLTFKPHDEWATIVWIFEAIIVSPAIIAACYYVEVPTKFRNLASFLGDISYPIYAIHFPLLTFIMFPLEKVGIPFLMRPIIIFPCLILIAYVVARFFDAPVRRRLSEKWKLRESAAPMFLDRR
ncbi:acyltransferase family protein [Tsuneonella mangrovi]|uniref:acyltransferase family protein n=1 Tax=Tsuneonella mangrovi TaxID=1982042 RepID=UPI000BA2246C|nr:acyltransferase [Tsuneonella mangrovi]